MMQGEPERTDGIPQDMVDEYRAVTKWVTQHGYLNAPMSERARQLLHRCFDQMGYIRG